LCCQAGQKGYLLLKNSGLLFALGGSNRQLSDFDKSFNVAIVVSGANRGIKPIQQTGLNNKTRSAKAV